jgi:hypothetical protein
MKEVADRSCHLAQVVMMAFDGDDRLIGSSVLRPISP